MTFEEHAAACYPNECCGLMVGGEYVPCRNTSTEKDAFRISPDDWAAAEDRGPVEAVCHSHPDETNHPSQSDLRGVEKTGLPWLIMAWPGGAVRRVVPSGWVAPLLGRTFHYGTQDCYVLAQDYYRTIHGIELPDFDHQEYGWWKHGKNLFLEGFQSAGFYEIPVAELRPGDAILMQINSPVPNHAAVLVEDGIILHHLEKRLSTRDVYGGYYRKVSVRYLRHIRCSPK